MQVGDLVKIVQGGTLVPPKKWLGKAGLVVDRFDHPQSTKAEWFTVIVAGDTRAFHEDYLELVNASR
jgi:hypothetical protein